MIKHESGAFGDLIYRGDELIVARSVMGKIITNDWIADVTDHLYLMFISVGLDVSGKIFVAGKANNSGYSVIVSDGLKTVIPYGQGNYSCQLGMYKGELVCFVVLSLSRYGISRLDGILISTGNIPEQYQGTSQGIRFVENETIFWGDQTIGGIFKGRIIREWVKRGPFIAGQGQEGGLPIVGTNVNYLYNPGGNTLFPRLAVKDNKISILYVDKGTVYWDTLLEEDLSKIIDPPVIVDDNKMPEMEAPNLIHLVEQVITEHPEVDRGNEATRGKIVEYFCIKANNGKDRPWGRKSRNSAGTDLNTDAAVFLRNDGMHEIYDILNGNPPYGATWGGDAPNVFKQGENGWWVPVGNVVVDNTDNTDNSNVDSSDLADLKKAVRELQTKVRELESLSLKYDDDVALQTASGKFVCAELGGKLPRMDEPLSTNRDAIGSWETFKLKKP